mmetsp:Transcript_2566/g.7524  ORF Transcript_2566/g.7524 Transcript_2566/m.7524 type:complete len:224 (+) Transcript_2566:99-770(+)
MPPPLPSHPLGVRLIGNPSATLIVELFQDLCCPFSRKMCITLNQPGGVFERIRADPSLASKVEFIFHNVPQPWHPQSPVMHECMFAVALAVDHDPEKLKKYIVAAFDAFPDFADLHVVDKSRKEIQRMCVDIAAATLADEMGGADAVRTNILSHLSFDHLTEEEPHMGLGEVTKLLKFHTKHHRTRGVHVTPTVYMNSIEAPDVSSGWSAEQWVEKLRSVCGE